MIKMSKFGAGIGAPSKEDRIRKAANIHIRLGNLQRYCELMVELGEVRAPPTGDFTKQNFDTFNDILKIVNI